VLSYFEVLQAFDLPGYGFTAVMWSSIDTDTGHDATTLDGNPIFQFLYKSAEKNKVFDI
jgi:hypothetical protein